MPLPRSSRRSTAKAVVYWREDNPLPVKVRRLLDAGDPALTAIADALHAAAQLGDDVRSPEVIDRCIAAGRLAHAAAQLGEPA